MKGKIDWQECLPKIQEIAARVYNVSLWAIALGIIPLAFVAMLALSQDNTVKLIGDTVLFIYLSLWWMATFSWLAKNYKIWCEILCRVTIYGASMMLMLLVIRATFRDMPVVALLIAGGITSFVISAMLLASKHISRYVERVARKGKAMLIAGMIEVIAFIVGGYYAVMLLYVNDVLELPKVSSGLIAGITLAHIGLAIGLYYLVRYVWQQYLLRKYRHSKILQEEILPTYDGDTVLVKMGTQSTMIRSFIDYNVFCNRMYDPKLTDAERYHIRFSHYILLKSTKEKCERPNEGKKKKRNGAPL